MNISAFSTGLLGALIGGGISLFGVWIQGRTQARLQREASGQDLAREHWLRQRDRQEETYRGLAHAILNVNGGLSRAVDLAKRGETPEPINIDAIQKDVAERAWTEVQVFGSHAVREAWKTWIVLMAQTSKAVGDLVTILRQPGLDPVALSVAWNAVDPLRSEMDSRSSELLKIMNEELAFDPSETKR